MLKECEYMRNKIFVFLLSLVFLLIFILSPISLLLTKSGVLEYNNVGNTISVDKTYPENHFASSLLNSFEEAKRDIKDTYINHFPFYLEVTSFFKGLEKEIDKPVVNWLQKKGQENFVVNCRHIWVESIVDPTCTKDGKITNICKLCNETKEETIPLLNHDYKNINTVLPTCESGGYTLLECSRCKETILENETKALGHSFSIVSEIPATCTSEGVTEYKCVTCESTSVLTYPKLNHTYINYVCENCSAKLLTDHTHSYKETTVSPTCESGGYILSVCDCGDSFKKETSLPLGHSYNTSVISPTCEADGYTQHICAVCNHSYKSNILKKLGHSYSEFVIEPTSSEGGYTYYECDICSHSYKDNFTEKLADIPESVTTADPNGTTYKADFHGTDSIFRNYALTATYPDGKSITSFARVVKLDRDELYNNMLKTADFVNAMVEKDKDINWYFYFPTNIEATPLADSFFPEESTRYIYEEFLTRLDESVKTDTLEVNSFTDYFNKYYITDHHWNHEGFNEAYLDIVRMLNKNYSDILPFEFKEKYVFEGVEFHGSLSRLNANYSFIDPFGLYYYEMPYHTVEIDSSIKYGAKVPLNTKIEEYIGSKYNKAKGYYHYTEFFRVCKEVNVPSNETGRNILIIGDSYSLPLLELVSCHFDNAYIRYEDRGYSNYPDELIYEEFIKEKGITDVLVIEEPAKCIMQGYGESIPSGFINIFPDENW